MTRHHAFAGAVAAFLAALPAIAPAETAGQPQIELMFVQTADDLVVDAEAGTIRLVDEAPQALYFSDRPVRLAGHLTMDEYLKSWTTGADSFGEDPPNATLSVYEDGNPQSTLVVANCSIPSSRARTSSIATS